MEKRSISVSANVETRLFVNRLLLHQKKIFQIEFTKDDMFSDSFLRRRIEQQSTEINRNENAREIKN